MNNNKVPIIEVENCTSNVSQHTHNTGQTVVVITGSPNFITPTPFGTKPQKIICPYCHYEVTTTTETKATMKTHLFALLLCIFSCWICCCCWCPYCIDCCQGKNHYCSNCDSLLGVYVN